MRFHKEFLAALMATTLAGGSVAYAQGTDTETAGSEAEATESASGEATGSGATESGSAELPPAMSATILDAEGGQLGGIELAFTQSGLAMVNLSLTGVDLGNHGVHLHETGECEAPFESAGGHLAGDKDHGVMSENGPHPGDMPNVTIPESGTLAVTYFVPGLTPELVQDEDGTAFVLHSGEDDYSSQPSGDAGDRLGCAVIAPPAG